MVRRISAAACAAVMLVGLGTGCRMCAHPFDYCGPTFTGQCGQSCDPQYRAGSILSGGMQPAGMVVPEGAVIESVGDHPMAAEPAAPSSGSDRQSEWVARAPRPER